MEWCERCGRFYIRRLNKYIVHAAVARGPVADIPTIICPACLRYGEIWDDGLTTITDA